MVTVTIPKKQYETLKKRASLYEAMLRSLPTRKWGIEEYSLARLKEFMSGDKLDRNTIARIRKFLAR